MWLRQFSRDRDRDRDPDIIKETEASRGTWESGRGEAEARQSENYVNILN